MSGQMACICHMTGWPVFWLRTETLMRSRLRTIWTTKSKLSCAKRQRKYLCRSHITKGNPRKSGGPDERRCSDDKSSRWNCGHYAGQRKAHLLRRGDGRRANRGVGRIRGRPQRSRCHRDWRRPGYFNRHFDIPTLIQIAESLRVSGRQWPENATYNGGFFDKAMALCESMPKPVIAAISGTALAGAFEFALACDLRIAEDGEYLIGLPEAELGLLPGAGGTQRLPRIIGTPAALMHILMGKALSPREAERKGLVHETVSGKALDRAMEIARRLSSHTPESLAYIKRLVRNATETPLAQGLALERNLF